MQFAYCKLHLRSHLTVMIKLRYVLRSRTDIKGTPANISPRHHFVTQPSAVPLRGASGISLQIRPQKYKINPTNSRLLPEKEYL